MFLRNSFDGKFECATESSVTTLKSELSVVSFEMFGSNSIEISIQFSLKSFDRNSGDLQIQAPAAYLKTSNFTRTS